MNAKRVFQLGSCSALAGAALFVPELAFAQACPNAATQYPATTDYNTAKMPAKACTTDDIKFIEAELGKANLTFTDFEKNLAARNQTCASCVFSKETDAMWGPITFVGNMGGAFAYYGACFARAQYRQQRDHHRE